MTGLPRANDNTRVQDDWAFIAARALEHVTEKLRAGAPFGEAALHNMEGMRRRYAAFCDALDARLPLSEEHE